MCILPQHKARIGVPDKFLYRSRVLPRVQHIRYNCMAKIVQAHPFRELFRQQIAIGCDYDPFRSGKGGKLLGSISTWMRAARESSVVMRSCSAVAWVR